MLAVVLGGVPQVADGRMEGEQVGVVELCPGIDHMGDARVDEGLDIGLGGQGGTVATRVVIESKSTTVEAKAR